VNPRFWEKKHIGQCLTNKKIKILKENI